PPMGTINVHGSLLPQYRGAAPINWAIINGEKETGVTTFKLKHEIDTGDILLQERMPIGDEETAGELHDRMKIMGAQLLVKTIEGLAAGTLKETPQENSNQLKHAPKIFTGTCKIDWARPGTEVHNLIRGLSPYPGAFTTVNQKIFKIFRSKKIDNYSENTSTVLSTASAQKAAAPGSLFTDRKSYLRFRCADGLIEALEVQFEGKKRMQIDEFLRGYGAQLPEKTG
ncbi:MAG TPA: methionyl-tRNA formyltransferase, partial [Parasegetibacter sp.]